MAENPKKYYGEIERWRIDIYRTGSFLFHRLRPINNFSIDGAQREYNNAMMDERYNTKTEQVLEKVPRNSERISRVRYDVQDLQMLRKFAAKKIYSQGQAIKELQSTVILLDDTLRRVLKDVEGRDRYEKLRTESGPILSPVMSAHGRKCRFPEKTMTPVNTVGDSGNVSTADCVVKADITPLSVKETQRLSDNCRNKVASGEHEVTLDAEHGEIEK